MKRRQVWVIAGLATGIFYMVQPVQANQIHKAKDFQIPDCSVGFKLAPGLTVHEHHRQWFSISKNQAKADLFIEDWTKSMKREPGRDFEKLATERCLGSFMADGPDGSIFGEIKKRSSVSIGGIIGYQYGVEILSVPSLPGYPRQGYCYIFDVSDGNRVLLLIIKPDLSGDPLSGDIVDKMIQSLHRTAQPVGPAEATAGKNHPLPPR